MDVVLLAKYGGAREAYQVTRFHTWLGPPSTTTFRES
jgi:hypothetical protein